MSERRVARDAAWLLLNEPRMRWHAWRLVRCKEGVHWHEQHIKRLSEQAVTRWPEISREAPPQPDLRE